MARFFIDRPVFAWVIAIVIMLAGALSIFTLPVEQFPPVAPPTVSINATYPGASAQTVENSVTQVIEQQLRGIDNLRYFSATSEATGSVAITLTFEPKTNPDIAQVQVQNKLQAAMSMLPEEVQRQGITVSKSSASFLMVVGFYAPQGNLTQYEIEDYVNSKLSDPLSRVSGVGTITVFGQPYAMRVWLDPGKMHSFNIVASEVQAAIAAQNADVSSGQLGGTPAVAGQQLTATITAQSRLKTVDEFEKILLRVNKNGSQIRLKDVARIELGPQDYGMVSRYQGKPAAGLAISMAAGANALQTSAKLKQRLVELTEFMPKGMEVVYPYDTTPFVRVSILEVVKTLGEAILLVVLVMYLFLQNFRATLIPTIAVPVVLLGTFGVLAAFGFSINTLTMFAMVLAIGLLVDDAIVVVENVERVMEHEGLSPREATKKSMRQITGALVGIALVLSAVFVPMAFLDGSSGAIYRQFSLTIVSAMALSVLVAIILTPALCATILKNPEKGHAKIETGFFGWFNRNFNSGRKAFGQGAGHVSRKAARYIVVYGVLVAAMVGLFVQIPTAFLPDEDQGIVFVQISTPAGSTIDRTLESVKQVENYFATEEKQSVEGMFSVVGWSFAGAGQNSAFAFVKLKDWAERKGQGQDLFSIVQRASMSLSAIKDASVFAFYPPSIMELGNASGFDMQLLDQGGLGHEALVAAEMQLLGMAAQDPRLFGVRPNGLPDVPEYKIHIDHEKASALGVSISDINSTLQSVWGSSYVNDFVHEGRTKRVYMQGDAPFRMNPDDVNKWYVRNGDGEMVPFSSFTSAEWGFGSPRLERYDGTPSLDIQGAPAPGVSSGTAMDIMQSFAAQLPKGIGYAWTGVSYEERSAGAQTPLLYTLSILFVFLCLAALYESWTVPAAVMLVVPLGILGAVVASLLTGLSNDVYFQVGLLTTVGLSAKNAILIVEFAKSQYDHGTNLYKATINAARQRLRPILMTSMAFILGVLPMAMANGAGSASQNAIGIGVIGGVASATFLAIFFVPMFFIVIQKLSGKPVTNNGK